MEVLRIQNAVVMEGVHQVPDVRLGEADLAGGYGFRLGGWDAASCVACRAGPADGIRPSVAIRAGDVDGDIALRPSFRGDDRLTVRQPKRLVDVVLDLLRCHAARASRFHSLIR